jgi:hypothetical protein
MAASKYSTGKPCKRGHTAERYVSTRQCVACQFENRQKWRSNKANREREVRLARTDKKRERCRAYNREQYAKDPARFNAASARWKEQNRELVLWYAREHKRQRRAYYSALEAERQAQKRRAMPAWADRTAIVEKYAEAARLTAETGIPHEVDHVVPICGRDACGLHVADNLRVVTARENRRKYNKLIMDAA